MSRSFALTLAVVFLVAAACLIDSGDAWGFGRRRNKGRFNSSSSGWANRTRSNTTFVAARCVDDPHPYYRSLSFSRNASLDELKANLSSFCNRSSAENLTMIVKNDAMLITKDAEVRRLGYKDRVEVWFSDSGAPTRAKTYYMWSKVARKAWKADEKKSGHKKGKKEGRRRRGGRRGGRRSGERGEEERENLPVGRRERPERRRRPDNLDEVDLTVEMDDDMQF